MVRVLIICSMLLSLTSCRGDKKKFRTMNLSNGDVLVEAVDSEKRDDSSSQKELKKDDPVIIAEKKKTEIVAAVKQLKMMLDASITAASPKRVTGIVVSNKTAEIPLRSTVPDALLYKTLDQVTDNSAFEKIKEMAGKKVSIDFDSRARLVATGSLPETIKAISILLNNPEMGNIKSSTALIPFSVELSANFFKTDPVINRKDFYAVLVTDKDGNYSHFNLLDRSYKEVGKVNLVITDSTEIKDQKMIVEFIDDSMNFKTEKVIPLQLQSVNFIK